MTGKRKSNPRNLRPTSELIGEGTTSQFSRSAKLDDIAIMRLVWGFCIGLPIDRMAAMADVSAKSARLHLLAFRDRLRDHRFNRWHGSNILILSLSDLGAQLEIKAALYDRLAGCHDNAKCAQNFHLGYRKTRLCRTCPLIGAFTSDAAQNEALGLVDQVRAFYRHLGLRQEAALDPAVLFRRRLIHTLAIATARTHSRIGKDGMPVPPDQGDLSAAALMDRMLTVLADDPL
jgi:hypothetical protein